MSMTMVQWPPYLRLGGLEVANAARTLAYMLRLGQAVGFRVEADPATLYDYLYRRAGASTFVAPGIDPAPWFSPSEPASSRFLGVLLDKPLGLGSTSTREPIPLDQGSAFGAEVLAGRELAFTGQVISLDARGQAFGVRWLADVLASSCGMGDLTTLELYTGPPPPGNDDEGWWTLYDVAQTVGVQQTDQADSPYVTPIAFTLTAGNPRFYRPYRMISPASVLDPGGTLGGPLLAFCDWLNGAPGPAHSASILPPTYGEVAAVVTIDAPGGVGGVDMLVHNSAVADPNTTVTLSGLPPGTRFQLDAARETCTYVDADGFATDGTSRLRLGEDRMIPWEWFQVAWCDEGADLTVETAHPRSYGATATVQIEAAERSR